MGIARVKIPQPSVKARPGPARSLVTSRARCGSHGIGHTYPRSTNLFMAAPSHTPGTAGPEALAGTAGPKSKAAESNAVSADCPKVWRPGAGLPETLVTSVAPGFKGEPPDSAAVPGGSPLFRTPQIPEPTLDRWADTAGVGLLLRVAL